MNEDSLRRPSPPPESEKEAELDHEMRDIRVSVGGQLYAMACDASQEQRLSELGAKLDARFHELQRACPGIADKHLLVMVGIMLCDDIDRLQQELNAKKVEISTREQALVKEDQDRLAQTAEEAKEIDLRRERLLELTDMIESDGRF